MGKALVALGIAGAGFLVGLALFPSFRAQMALISTSGFPTLLAAIVTGFPYILLAFLIFWAMTASRSK